MILDTPFATFRCMRFIGISSNVVLVSILTRELIRFLPNGTFDSYQMEQMEQPGILNYALFCAHYIGFVGLFQIWRWDALFRQ